jgi:UDP-N-acetylglucosamine diphosphorylase / glucose-1-phosphate thymidylyltransferase / UDP-N-acetylgalactosamine diphosphorylase / glucosamine-1-phosphate N-acetyltransferase / galactosamine-1-phosphate N-acetyltransferase
LWKTLGIEYKGRKNDKFSMATHPSYFFDWQLYAHAELFEGISNVWEALEKLADYLQTHLPPHTKTTPPAYPGVYFENPSQIHLGKDVRIEPGAYIRGPCWIGEGSVIRHGAYIRGDVVTGTHCVIGHGTEIKHSILFDKAHAPHFNYVGDSILGNSVNLGAGVKCANFRLDQNPIYVRIGKEKIYTGLKKLGVIVGDRGQLGCNCVTNPGTLLGPGVLCPPCQNITGFIPRDSHLTRSLHPLTS